MTSTCSVPVAAVLAATLAVAGCTQTLAGSPVSDDSVSTSSAPKGPPSTEPSDERPREIDLNGRDPCGLIPQTDWARFNIERPGQAGENPNFGSPECYYPGTDAGFSITLVVTENITAWNSRDVTIENAEPIEGFPAITMANNIDDRACYGAVDVADRQYLLTTATPDPRDPDQPEKCDLAYQLAQSAMKTLVAS